MSWNPTHLDADASGDDHLTAWLAAYLRTRPEAAGGSGPPSGEIDEEMLGSFRRLASTVSALCELWPRGLGRDDSGGRCNPEDLEQLESSDTFSAPFRFGRFRVLSELGRGGGGIVFRALDPVLGRIVALKVPQPQAVASPKLRERFLREAKAVAALSHPNLVQVFEANSVGPVGYISSAYCPGPTLAAWLEGRDRRVSPLWAAGLMSQLANVVAYVHRQGILHRDLKPGNVLLETLPQSGDASRAEREQILDVTPKLTDFGLARVDTATNDQTRSGTVLGTPCYMAPEQAEGRLGDMGPATDVYALGVTLYELLVGRPPYRGKSDHETLRLVVEGKLSSPRRRQPDVPRDLEAVCLKCLEREPDRRYQTAADLAADLSRFIRGEPVAARRAGIVIRWVKAFRRRPLVWGLSAALTASLIMGAAVAGWQWYRAEMNSRRAEADFRQAHDAVRAFHVILDDGRFDAVEFQPLRKEILDTALHYYRAFLDNHAGDAALRADIAEARYRIGFACLDVNRDTDALDQLRQALPIWEALTREFPANPEYPYFLAKTHRLIGWLHDRAGRKDEAFESYRRACDLGEELARSHPSEEKYRTQLAESLSALGALNREMRRFEESMDCLHRAVEILRSTTLTDAQTRHQIAEYLSHLGLTHLRAASYEAALEDANRGREILEELVEENERMPWSANDLGRTYHTLGRTHLARGQSDAALEWYRRARQVQETLVREHPEVSNFAATLATTFASEASLHQNAGRAEQAVVCLRRACALHEEWLAEAPDVVKARETAAATYQDFGEACDAAGQSAEALVAYQREVEMRRHTCGDRPQDPRKEASLAAAYARLAGCLENLGRFEEAADALEQAKEHRRDSSERRPGRPADQDD